MAGESSEGHPGAGSGSGPPLCPAWGTSYVESSSLMIFWLQGLSFLFSWGEAWVHLESLIFHVSGRQWRKSASVADRSLCNFSDYLMECKKHLRNAECVPDAAFCRVPYKPRR